MPRRKSTESTGGPSSGRMEKPPGHLLFKNIPDLYSLSPEQEEFLAKEIELHHGTVVGAIHALYNWGGG